MKSFRGYLVEVGFLTMVFISIAYPQLYETKIFEYVRMVSKGNGDEVASKFSDLRNKLPRGAGMIYLEGLVATDGHDAIRCFHVITDSFPRSDWADDALARIFECQAAMGEPIEAEETYQRLKQQYPASPYITTGYLQQQVLDEAITAADRKLPDSQQNEWAIQVGAFTKKENAEKLLQKITADGYLVNIYENLLDGKNLYYLVWVGSFNSEEEAKPLLKEIKAKYKIEGVLRARQVWKKW
jgi:SPOR domain